MAASLWLTLLVACIVISFTPGAGAINTMGNALNHGFRRAIWGILGQQAALIVHIAIVALGVGVLVASSPVLFNVIRYAGAAYLAYLGLGLLRARGAGLAPVHAHPARAAHHRPGVRLALPRRRGAARTRPLTRAGRRRAAAAPPRHAPLRAPDHRSRNAQSGRCPARTNERTMSASPCRRSIASAIAA